MKKERYRDRKTERQSHRETDTQRDNRDTDTERHVNRECVWCVWGVCVCLSVHVKKCVMCV